MSARRLVRLGAVAAAVLVMALTAPATPAAATPGDPDASSDVRCFSTVGEHHAYTILGATFYRFLHRADWCVRDGLVVAVTYRDHAFLDASAFAQFRGLTEDFVTPVPSPQVVSTKKATVENCIPIHACISVHYPYVRLVRRGDGSWYALDGE